MLILVWERGRGKGRGRGEDDGKVRKVADKGI
jgi:hypothetical protein